MKKPRRLTSEANDHTYGFWRGLQCEFNLAKICGIDEKRHNYTDDVFKCGLKACCSMREFRGYQQIFGKYVESANKSSTYDGGGPVGVDYEQTVVDKLWSEVQVIINMVNAAMLPF